MHEVMHLVMKAMSRWRILMLAGFPAQLDTRTVTEEGILMTTLAIPQLRALKIKRPRDEQRSLSCSSSLRLPQQTETRRCRYWVPRRSLVLRKSGVSFLLQRSQVFQGRHMGNEGLSRHSFILPKPEDACGVRTQAPVRKRCSYEWRHTPGVGHSVAGRGPGWSGQASKRHK
jgi:hypothetical protein